MLFGKSKAQSEADMGFNMELVGANIMRFRKEAGMTQTDLADKMGISFQAVSNWERGQSCPDVAKLIELSQLFGVSVDAILGNEVAAPSAKETVVAVDAATGEVLEPEEPAEEAAEPEEPPVVENDDLASLMPLIERMDADAVGEIARRRVAKTGAITSIVPMLDYMDVDDIGEIARDFVEKTGAIATIQPLLDYMDVDDIGAVARIFVEKTGTVGSIVPLLDYMDIDDVDEVALQYVNQTGDLDGIQSLLDYMSEDSIGEVAEAAERCRWNQKSDRKPKEDAAKESAQGKKYSFNDVVRIAPFVDRQLLDQMVRECYEENGDFIEIAKVAPFISKSVLDELVRKVYERHSNLKQMVRVAPFVSKDVLVELAEKCVADHNGDVGSLSAIAPFLPKSTLDRLLRETFGGSEE